MTKRRLPFSEALRRNGRGGWLLACTFCHVLILAAGPAGGPAAVLCSIDTGAWRGSRVVLRNAWLPERLVRVLHRMFSTSKTVTGQDAWTGRSCGLPWGVQVGPGGAGVVGGQEAGRGAGCLGHSGGILMSKVTPCVQRSKYIDLQRTETCMIIITMIAVNSYGGLVYPHCHLIFNSIQL